MKIKIDSKLNTLEFIPENDIDTFQLGNVFGNKSHRIGIGDKKINYLSVEIEDIWRQLQIERN